MSARSILAGLTLVAALSACSPIPFGMGDDEWGALSPREKVELRQQWYAARFHPTAMLTPAISPASAVMDDQGATATKRLQQENADLTLRLHQAEKKVATLQQQIQAVTILLAGPNPPALASTPSVTPAENPPEKSVEKPVEKPADKPAEKPAEATPTDTTANDGAMPEPNAAKAPDATNGG